MKKIYIFHREYYPRNNSGGPTRSISRLIDSGEANYTLVLPYKDERVDVDNIAIWELFAQASISGSHIFHLNSFWSPYSILLVLLYWKSLFYVSPRGELFPQALSHGRSRLKQLIFPAIKSLLSVRRCVIFYSSDEEKDNNMKLLPNFDHRFLANLGPKPVKKITNSSGIVSLGRAHRIKNFVTAVNGVIIADLEVVYDLFLVPTDPDEFMRISSAAKECSYINIKDPLDPWLVYSHLSRYEFLIAISDSENFGHSIAEALANGLIVIVGAHTPWSSGLKRINDNLVLNDVKDSAQLSENIKRLLNYSQPERKKLRRDILAYYTAQYENMKINKAYAPPNS